MILSNNRFLHRTNTEITRALADSGSSLNHSELQRLMRQQVDLGNTDNLVLWLHSGLVKTRTSGSDTFIPKAYNLAGITSNDGLAGVEANEPKLITEFFEFNGSNNYLGCGTHSSLGINNYLSISAWLYPAAVSGGINRYIISRYAGAVGGRGFTLRIHSSNIIAGLIRNAADTTILAVESTYDVSSNLNSWVHVTITYDKDDKFTIYINGNWNAESTAFGLFQISYRQLEIGGLGASGNYNGRLNDVRIYNSTLSATQVSKIYNETKSYYGIT